MRHLKTIAISLLLTGGIAAQAAAPAVTTTADGLVVATKGANVRIQPVTDRIIRVSATPDKNFAPDNSLVVVKQDSKPQYTVTEKKDYASLSTKEVTVRVNKKSGEVTFYDSKGKKILQEQANGRDFKPITVDGTQGYTVQQNFDSLDNNEGIYGLGQHQSNEFNYKGKNEELFQYNTKVSVPFVVSTDHYGILWDSYSLCRWGNPKDYSQLGDIFTLYNKQGQKGSLTGTYEAADGKTMTRDEKAINFEHLVSHTLDRVVNTPDFNFANSHVTFEGELEPKQTGDYEFILYYSGSQSVEIDGKKMVQDRWRSPWNPNSYKFSVHLTAGKRVPIKISWNPEAGIAYCGLRAYAPRTAGEKAKMCWWGEMQDMIDYYFIYGTTMDQVIAGYRTLTGKAPIMPKWAMGYWQSREKYNTQDEVLGTLAEFRKRQIPIDNIVIDWLHWKEDSWGSHEFDRARFPHPKAMMDSIHAMDGRVMVSVWPKFYATTEHFKQFDEKGWMYPLAIKDSIRDWVGPGYIGSFYDAYSPDARKLFWNQIEDHYYPLGIDAWWMDASEPNIRDCTEIGYRKELCGPTALGPSTKYFNAYGLVNADAIYNGQRGADHNKRVFLLTRSGFAGQQRYSTATWSGDIASVWEDLEAQIPAGLNFAMSGVPWWTMDIGGFTVPDRFIKAQRDYNETGAVSDDLKEWRELNTRWYQYGAFSPLFRAHGQWPFREIYNIAPEGDPTYNSILYYTKLRYNMMPYIYSLAGKTHFDDYTVMRPMVMDFTYDPKTRDVKDQFMFGPSFLAAPVYHYGDRERDVYLPTGSVWYDFYTGAQLKGGQTVKASAPYERMPLFVKGGTIVPYGPDVQSTAEKSTEPLTIAVYGGANGDFTLYEDEGTNYDYEKGLFSKINLHYDNATNTLTISDREGKFPGMQEFRKFNIVKVDATHPLGEAFKAQGKVVDYTGGKTSVKL